MFEIIGVTTVPLPPAVRACMLDWPRGGERIDGKVLEVVGWVVGRDVAVEAVEIRSSDRLLVRIPMIAGREDVASLYSDSPQGSRVSFHGRVALPPRFDGVAELRVVRENGEPELIASLRIRATAARLRGIAVLLYHRIASPVSEPWSMSVSPDHFAEHLEIIARRTRVLRAAELDGMLEEPDETREPSIVVTFDDGYADNLIHALPLLEKHDIPATVFLASGFIGQNHEFWWDELERVLLLSGDLPRRMEIEIAGQIRAWELGDDASLSQEQARLHCGWRAGGNAFPTGRHRLYRTLWEILSELAPTVRARAMDRLAEWAGIDRQARATHRSLTDVEMQRFAASPLIEIGAHTVTHSALASLSPEAQRLEIGAGRADLSERINRPVTRFAYPYGQKSHYTRESMTLLQEEGFSAAFANWPAPVSRASDRFEIPRFNVPDVDGDELERRLERWLSG